jgi:large subunit ribosomal protein L9
MEVILTKDVDRLGRAGDIVNVKDGFANNHLFPKSLALPSSSTNLRKLEEENRRKTLQAQRHKAKAEELKLKLDNLSITLPVLVQSEDKLYGSITAQEIASSLKEEGFDIDKNSILLTEPIKSLGIYEIILKLHPEVSAKIKIWIVKK